MDAFVLLVLSASILLPIVYSVILFIIGLNQLNEIKDTLDQLRYEKHAVSEIVETIGEDLAKNADKLHIVEYQVKRQNELFTVHNGISSEVVHEIRHQQAKITMLIELIKGNIGDC